MSNIKYDGQIIYVDKEIVVEASTKILSDAMKGKFKSSQAEIEDKDREQVIAMDEDRPSGAV